MRQIIFPDTNPSKTVVFSPHLKYKTILFRDKKRPTVCGFLLQRTDGEWICAYNSSLARTGHRADSGFYVSLSDLMYATAERFDFFLFE